MALVQAPWTPEQVTALNVYQRNRHRHPLTCGGPRSDAAHTEYARQHRQDRGQLVAHAEGWRCPVCGYTQDWAHDFMLKLPALWYALSSDRGAADD